MKVTFYLRADYQANKNLMENFSSPLDKISNFKSLKVLKWHNLFKTLMILNLARIQKCFTKDFKELLSHLHIKDFRVLTYTILEISQLMYNHIQKNYLL